MVELDKDLGRLLRVLELRLTLYDRSIERKNQRYTEEMPASEEHELDAEIEQAAQNLIHDIRSDLARFRSAANRKEEKGQDMPQ